MKVLHVSNLVPSEEFPHRGIFMEEQIRSLNEIGIENELHPLPTHLSKLEYFKIGKFKNRVVQFNPDIIHIHFSWAAIPVLLSPTSVPAVVSFCGDDLYGSSGESLIHRTKSKFVNIYNAILSRNVDHCLVKAEEMKKYLTRVRSLPEHRISVIPNGINLEKFSLKSRSDARQKLDLQPDKKYVLNLANPDGLTDVKRVWLAESSIEELAKKHPDVEFLNPFGISHDEVALYMNAVDCYLLTSRSEGSPNVVKESLACGTPVISTDVGDVADRIEGLPGCEIVKPEKSSIMGRLEKTLFGSNVDREKIRSAIKPLEQTKIAQQIEAIYEKLV